MKRCPNCGKLNLDSANFCKYCGHKIAGVKSAPKSQSAQPRHVAKSSGNNSMHSSSQPRHIAKSSNSSSSQHRVNQPNQSYHISNNTNNNQQQRTTQRPQTRRPQPQASRNQQYNYGNRQNVNYQSQPKQPNYQQNWQHANQSFNQATTYSSNYFQWFMNGLLHPTQIKPSHPYFGITSLLIEAVIFYISLVISNASEEVGDALHDFLGFLPLKAFYQHASYSPVSELILIVLAFGIYVLVDYIFSTIGSNQHVNFFACTNRLASYTSANVAIIILILFSAAINKASLVWFFAMCMSFTFDIGLALNVVHNSRKGHFDYLYLSILALLALIIAKGIVALIINSILFAG